MSGQCAFICISRSISSLSVYLMLNKVSVVLPPRTPASEARFQEAELLRISSRLQARSQEAPGAGAGAAAIASAAPPMNKHSISVWNITHNDRMTKQATNNNTRGGGRRGIVDGHEHCLRLRRNDVSRECSRWWWRRRWCSG